MKERGHFMYHDPDQVIRIKFEKDGKGVPIEALLPASGRGDGFADFRVKDYLGLASLVLVSPDEWTETCQAAASNPEFKTATEQSPVRFNPPAPNLDYLRLRTSAGAMDPDRTAELFEVVQAYWTAPPETLALEPGVVAAMWRKGLTAAEILQYLRENSQHDPETNQLKLVLPKVSPDVELISSLLPPETHRDDLTEAKLDQLISWLRTVPRGHVLYEHAPSAADDLRFLEMVDDNGNIDTAVTNLARDHIWPRLDQPDYPTLWRHIQAQKGMLPAEDPNSDYSAYNLHIAGLADNGIDNLGFVRAVLELAHSEVAVPTEKLFRAARVMWEQEQATKKDRSTIKTGLQAQPLDLGRWLQLENYTHFMRKAEKLVAINAPRTEIEAFLETAVSKAGTAQTLKQYKAHYLRTDFRDHLKQLGVVDQGDQWSEVGFMRQHLMMVEAEDNGVPPSLERMRWAMHLRYHSGLPVPFTWPLIKDRLPAKTVQRARMLASMALSGGMADEKFQIDEVITPEQFQILWKFGAWLSDDADLYLNDEYPDLDWLAKYAQQPRLHLEDWREVCDFIFGKLNQVPDPTLLQDHLKQKRIIVPNWRDDGHQQSSSKPFNLPQKIGRNDPCPCGSGKKYKKCCGR